MALELNNIHFDTVFCSPLIRARNTAQKIKCQDIMFDERIIERSFGSLEGKYGIPDYENNLEKYNIESIEELKSRVTTFLNEVLENYKEKENILIVTHEGIAQVINWYFNKETSLKEFRLGTGEYKIYEY